MSVVIEFAFPLPNGLHARPATVLREYTLANGVAFRVANRRSEREARSTDVMDLVSLDLRQGDPCAVTVTGSDAQINGLRTWLSDTFPHCDTAIAVTASSAGLGTVVTRLLAESAALHAIGRGVSDGIGSGIAVLMTSGLPATLPARLCASASDEIASFQFARIRVNTDIQSALKTCSGTERDVLAAHAAMLDDAAWQERVKQVIANGVHAAAAVLQVGRSNADGLAASDNAYLAGRAADVRDVTMRLLAVIPGGISQNVDVHLSEPSVIIADDLTPSALLALERSKLAGLVLVHGSATGHTAILARSFAIPCVVGATLDVRAGTIVLVDGRRGVAIANPPETVLSYFTVEQRGLSERRQRLARRDVTTGATADGASVHIEANLASADEAAPTAASGADGVGLFRTEMLFLGRASAPSEDDQYASYRAVAEAFGERHVTIRLIDIGGDKQIDWLPLPHEDNPFLGVRGVRLYEANAELIRTQLRALLRAAVHGQLRIMIPMVAERREIRLVRALLAEAAETLRSAGIPHRADVPVGIMVEVPAAAMHLEVLAKEADFLCVGTNDLAQYLFAADRGNPAVSKPEHEAHPAFLRVLSRIATDARQAGRPVAICGELAGRLQLLPILVGLGFGELSMAPSRIHEAKSALATLDSARCADLAKQCCAADDAAAVFELLRTSPVIAASAPLVDRDLVVLDCDATTKTTVIKTLVEQLRALGRSADPQSVEDAIWAREAVYSTGIGHAFAIPHCKSDALTASSVVVVRMRNPIEWQSLDGEPVRMAILLAIRASDGGDTHMRVFAKLARRLMNDEFRDGMLHATDRDAVVQILREQVLG